MIGVTGHGISYRGIIKVKFGISICGKGRRKLMTRLKLTVFLFLICTASSPVAGDQGSSPLSLDARSLPLWEAARWNDFPVRIELSNTAELDRLLALVPVASFQREQISRHVDDSGHERLIFEPRVTEAEAAALLAAGYRYVRMPDVDSESRLAAEQAWAAGGLKSAAGYYPTNAEIGTILAQLELDYPAICRRFIWGSSVEGRELWGLVVSADVQNTAPEPEIRLSGSMHGDEPVGMAMLMSLADYLATKYGQAGFEDVTDLVDNYEIHIMPLHNPDGYVAGTRSNANLVDLNRNFAEPAGTHTVQETENIHFMTHALMHNFVISGNSHGGALVVNYPWDYKYERAPDDAALIKLSLEYSTYNLPMYNGSFSQGITNGADWYVTTGCLQDWSYYGTGCIDLTLELSDSKWPPASQLDGLWDDNRESFMHFIKAARYGVNGVVTDADTGLPLDATVTVVANAAPVTTDHEYGDYYKLLATGTYDLVFEADGYVTSVVTDVATEWGTPTILNVALASDISDVPDRPAVSMNLTASPNPFNPNTTFTLTNPRPGLVTLNVFDLQGRRVRKLLEGYLTAGQTEVVWDGTTARGDQAPSGVYFAQLSGGGLRALTKVVLLK